MPTEREAFEHALLVERVATRCKEADDLQETLEIPADTSKKSLSGWIAGIELAILSFPAGSRQRAHVIAEAGKQIDYLKFLLKSQPSLKSWLEGRKRVLEQKLNTESS